MPFTVVLKQNVGSVGQRKNKQVNKCTRENTVFDTVLQQLLVFKNISLVHLMSQQKNLHSRISE